MAKGLQRFLPKRFRKQRTVVPVVRLTGMIAADSGGIGRKALSMATIEPLLDKAFEIKDAPVVAIEINSPGGSPVQSALIAARIRRLAEETNVPVHAFVEDVAASGGYWLATAADTIWADDSSVLGSIGVISAGFGFATGAGVGVGDGSPSPRPRPRRRPRPQAPWRGGWCRSSC